MGVEAVFPCDTGATATDLNADDKVLPWRPSRGACSSLSMDRLHKHKGVSVALFCRKHWEQLG